MRPDDFIKSYSVKSVETKILEKLPFYFPVEEWPSEYRPFLTRIRTNKGELKVLTWGSFLRQVEGIRGLPNVISCLAYDIFSVEGKTYPQWCKHFSLSNCEINRGIYYNILAEARRARNVFGVQGFDDLMMIAKKVKKLYE